MKNTFGQSVTVTLFGESHGEYIGAILDGLAPGIKVNEDFIESQLTRRRPYGKISTQRREQDKFKIVSGVFNNRTTGTPITILIPNESTKSADYSEIKNILRPSHADYTAYCKYHSFQDYRGGGHFSGRLTAPLVAIGAICIEALSKKGIYIGTHIKKCGGVEDESFTPTKEEILSLEGKKFPTLSDTVAKDMIEKIEAVASEGDSIGGILETAVIGLPKGLGEPWFDSIEGVLSHGLFSIPAIKGVEFGLGFGFADSVGSKVNDSFKINDGKIETTTNNNGGINGGITNGMPIIFSCAIKPTPSIYKEQATVNIETMENTTYKIKGRHDPAIIQRAGVVVDSLTAIILSDILSLRFGTDYLLGE